MLQSDKQWLFLQDVAKLIAYAKERGYKLTGGELYRTEYQQREYVRQGLSRTEDSMHPERLAIDLNVFVKDADGYQLTSDYGQISDLGEYWEGLSPQNRWGGNFKSLYDPYHFERQI